MEELPKMLFEQWHPDIFKHSFTIFFGRLYQVNIIARWYIKQQE